MSNSGTFVAHLPKSLPNGYSDETKRWFEAAYSLFTRNARKKNKLFTYADGGKTSDILWIPEDNIRKLSTVNDDEKQVIYDITEGVHIHTCDRCGRKYISPSPVTYREVDGMTGLEHNCPDCNELSTKAVLVVSETRRKGNEKLTLGTLARLFSLNGNLNTENTYIRFNG